MDDIKERVAEIVGGINLERKQRATKKEKEAYASLKEGVSGIKNDIDKLNLRLWHALSKGDYHSLSVEEAKEALADIRDRLECIISTGDLMQ